QIQMIWIAFAHLFQAGANGFAGRCFRQAAIFVVPPGARNVNEFGVGGRLNNGEAVFCGALTETRGCKSKKDNCWKNKSSKRNVHNIFLYKPIGLIAFRDENRFFYRSRAILLSIGSQNSLVWREADLDANN